MKSNMIPYLINIMKISAKWSKYGIARWTTQLYDSTFRVVDVVFVNKAYIWKMSLGDINNAYVPSIHWDILHEERFIRFVEYCYPCIEVNVNHPEQSTFKLQGEVTQDGLMVVFAETELML